MVLETKSNEAKILCSVYGCWCRLNETRPPKGCVNRMIGFPFLRSRHIEAEGNSPFTSNSIFPSASASVFIHVGSGSVVRSWIRGWQCS